MPTIFSRWGTLWEKHYDLYIKLIELKDYLTKKYKFRVKSEDKRALQYHSSAFKKATTHHNILGGVGNSRNYIILGSGKYI